MHIMPITSDILRRTANHSVSCLRPENMHPRMSEKYLYLALNFGAISIPFISSFYRKAPFIRSWRAIIPALLIPLIFFIIWDVIFTKMGVWGFNIQYLSGIYIINLPLEEWLFFITIPYACLFSYFALKILIPVRSASPKWNYVLGSFFLFIGILHIDKLYTSTTFVGLGLLWLFLGLFKWKFTSQFLLSFLPILLPFFLINGVLTGSWIPSEVVWYNDTENMGIRLGTIPLEDVFYGMFLLLFNCVIWERFNIQLK